VAGSVRLLDGFLRKFLLEGGFDMDDVAAGVAGATGEPRRHLYGFDTQPQPLMVADCDAPGGSDDADTE